MSSASPKLIPHFMLSIQKKSAIFFVSSPEIRNSVKRPVVPNFKRMKITILIGFIISTLNLYSQIQIQEFKNCDSSVITTLEQNIKWIDNIVKADFEKKLEILGERILLDTNVCVPSYYCDRFKIKIYLRDSSKIKSEGKPLIIFDNYPLYITEFDNYKNVEFISSLINSENIKNLKIWSGDTANAVWGTRANFGVFLLQTKYNSSFETVEGQNFFLKQIGQNLQII